MKLIALGSILAAGLAGIASASVTLNFSAPPLDWSGGLLGSGGETSGLLYGVLIDTAGNGFSSEYTPDFMVSNGALLTTSGGPTDDLLWLATGVTGASPAPGGIISGVAAIPIGANAGGSGLTTAVGQAFGLVWFDPAFVRDANAVAAPVGLLNDPGFVLPPDGTTGGGYNTLDIFTGNPVRSTEANNVMVPEPSAALLGLIGLLGFIRRRR